MNKRKLLRSAAAFLGLLTVLNLSTAALAAAPSYQSYYENSQGAAAYGKELFLTSEHIKNIDALKTVDFAGKEGVPLISQNEEIVFEAVIPAEGLYPVSIEYCAYDGTNADIEIALEVDGAAPFSEAGRIFLPRLWEYDLPEGTERFELDNRGNEQQAFQREVRQFGVEALRDKEGYFDDGFVLKLSAGTHTIKIKCIKESLLVSRLILGEEQNISSYKEYLREHPGSATPEYYQKIEAEKPYLRSTAKIYPSFDRSSPDVSPSDPAKIRLNAIGGENWKYSGEWLSYQFYVPADGYYNISFKYIQNLVRGLSTTRKITIDDKLLFQELKEVKFGYGLDWQYKTLADSQGAPYKLYLEEGTHYLKLEAKLGEAASTLRVIEGAVADLNTIYRQIVMVTGTAPDPYRDYMLDREITELVPNLERVHATLENEVAVIETRSGSSGTEAAFFYDLIRQLEDFIEDTHNITSQASRLDRFKQNISGLAELLLRLKEQPLMLDYIVVHSDGTVIDHEKAGFLSKVWYRLQAFFYSFIEDYTSLGDAYGEEGGEPLNIWVSVNDMMTTGVSSGRDQAELLKRLVDDDFTKRTGQRCNLSLVNTSDTLLQAIVGGNNPDVALFVPKTMTINLAMRGALTDVSLHPDFDSLKERFHPSALIANIYNGGIYGVPETQSFHMLFYRTDIFDELGLEPPETWDEFYDVTAKLQKKNMQVGIPESQTIFEMLLLQNGGNIYNDDLSAVNLTTEEAVKAFTDWTDLYKQYELPLVFDFFNRFRTGEMPMGINSFVIYNQLSVAAPEIRNQWAMVPIPGYQTEEGIIRSQSCTGSSAIIPKASKQQEAAFTFVDWWTSETIQTRFGNELETILGTAARYNSANLKAFNSFKWTTQELESLNTAREDVTDIYQTPASYYISRSITNAFRKVVYYYYNDREVLNKYANDMNSELKRKRQEFGLE